MSDGTRKPIHFIGSSHKDLRGLGGAAVLELVEDDMSGTYRAVFTVRFTQAVYVLHVFQKKSRRGVATPKADIELIKWRLRQAERHYNEHHQRGSGR